MLRSAVNKSNPEPQLASPTNRSTKKQILYLARELFSPLTHDAVLPETSSTRFSDKMLTSYEFGPRVREFLGFPPYRLEARVPTLKDKLGLELYGYLFWVNRHWPRILAEPYRWAAPMANACKLSISIPVAAHNEERHIYRTLKEYSKQAAPRETFEICLYVNMPQHRADKTPIIADRTIDEINRALTDFPDLNICCRYVHYDKPAPIGTIRLHADASILYRHWERCNTFRDHLILRADADSTRISPRLVSAYIREAEKFPKVSLFRGPIDFDPAAKLGDVGYLLTSWIQMYVQSLYQATDNKAIFVGGANSMYRVSDYVRVGGYAWDSTFGEDTELGRALTKNSEKMTNMRLTGARTRIETSARRSIETSSLGYPANYAWSVKDTQFRIDDAHIRNIVPTENSEATFEGQLSDPDFSHKMSGLISHTLRGYSGHDSSEFRSLVEKIIIERLELPVFFDDKTTTVILRDPEILKEKLRLWRDIARIKAAKSSH